MFGEQTLAQLRTGFRLVGTGKDLGSSEIRSSVKVEVVVLGSPSLISLMVSVDVKQH